MFNWFIKPKRQMKMHFKHRDNGVYLWEETLGITVKGCDQECATNKFKKAHREMEVDKDDK